MIDPLLRQRCESLADLDLVRAVTLTRADNSDEFVDEALAELERRGATLAQRVDHVQVRAGSSPATAATIADALSMVHEEVPRRAVASFACLLGPALVLQREGWGWVLHEYDGDAYGGSYLAGSTQQAADLLGHFLRLEDWRAAAGPVQHLDNWTVLDRSPDAATMEALSDRLTASGVNHVVRPALFAPADDESIAVLVAPSDRNIADDVLGRGAAAARRLRQHALDCDRTGDRLGELAAYDELRQIEPDAHAVHYNRGAVLLELERPEDAAAAFMEAVAVGLAQQRPDLSLGKGSTSGGGLGLFGVAARLVSRSAASASPPSWPDWFEDADLQLVKLLDLLGARVDLLHSLASLARVRGDTDSAEQRYRQILQLAPDDDIARFQLQYLAAAMAD